MVGHRVIERALTPQREQRCGRERARGHAIVVEVLPRCAHCAARTATLRLTSRRLLRLPGLLMCVAARPDGKSFRGGSVLRGLRMVFFCFVFVFLRMLISSPLCLSRARTQATLSFRGSLSMMTTSTLYVLKHGILDLFSWAGQRKDSSSGGSLDRGDLPLVNLDRVDDPVQLFVGKRPHVLATEVDLCETSNQDNLVAVPADVEILRCPLPVACRN